MYIIIWQICEEIASVSQDMSLAWSDCYACTLHKLYPYIYYPFGFVVRTTGNTFSSLPGQKCSFYILYNTIHTHTHIYIIYIYIYDTRVYVRVVCRRRRAR
uniref:Uncharacterized protein n=1 Tax=Schizaphis graminum TaxID=13262 RepID=A0A2S2NY64_SCHGA